MIGVYLAALGATMAAQAAPGPNLLAVAGAALGQGRAPAVAVAAGVASGVLVWVSAFALGVSSLFQAYPQAGALLQLVGGGYFVWIGWRALRAARHGQASTIRAHRESLSLMAAWRRGLLVVLTNPKAAIMWAAITAFLSGAGLSPAGVMLFAPLGACSAFCIYGGYGVLFSTATSQRLYQRAARGFEATFGALFTLLGIMLLYDGVRAVRGNL